MAGSARELATVGARGAVSLGLRTIFFAALSLVRIALVARLLGPEELGVFGLVTAVAEGARAFANVGSRNVLVQRAEVDGAHIGTFWAFSAGEAVLGALIVMVITPIAGKGVPVERLLTLAALIALAQLASVAANPERLVAERRGQFGRIASLEAASAIVEFAAVIVFAVWLRRAEALGLGLLVRSIVDVAISYCAFPRPQKLRLDRAVAREFFLAGTSLFIVSVGSYATIYGDNLLVARFLGPEALGFYIAAYRLAELPFRYMVDIANRVTLATLSRLQTDLELRARAVERVMDLQFLCLWPLVVFLLAFAPAAIRLTYGAKFANAAPLLSALALLTLSRGAANFIGPVLLAFGEFRRTSWLKSLEAVTFVAAVTVGLRWGLLGVAVGAGVGYTCGAIAWGVWGLRLLGVRGRAVARTAWGGVVAFAIFGALYVTSHLSGTSPGHSIPYALAFVVLYAVAAAISRRALLLWLFNRIRGAAAP